ncbi:MAG: branched-chain amino acid ABC transporter permease [Desulfofustis sp.]|nr:branched-chain amino acid ABC transporter permease [Desulfofustis sp.]RZW23422.1 MAG: branched-chain amino acid ABC transporter permease [Desulfobulbaceae bacterium]MBT8353033.1 branched-chain amino acid ABC transporter permease [Desulfofustis sp.]NNF46966.1 branched-chain amino acid ABC transporter permease [Desulfofustis sp.]NNK15208.1 branched-chain amino acid ABC transporter permease [Desulfofustis sp.]
MILLIEQVLNGLQLGITLFLMSAGLTLVFGIMQVINLAHGSFYMIGAYVGATVAAVTGSFLLAVLAALGAAGLAGMAVELVVLRQLYKRDHLDQVLATFGLIFFFNEMTRILWGKQPLFMDIPFWLKGNIELLPGLVYPVYRLAVIVVGIVVALLLWYLFSRTRLGMQIRAGASNREMIAALGVNIKLLYTLVFGLGTLLAGLAGVMAGPIFAVESGMGESILILTFVVIVIGGIGSVRGAVIGALLVGLVDTLGRAFLPTLFRAFFSSATADSVGASLASMSIYILMAAVLIWKPRGLFPSYQ